MNNKGIAFGDLFKIISEGNTAIIHYSFMRQPDKREFEHSNPVMCTARKKQKRAIYNDIYPAVVAF